MKRCSLVEKVLRLWKGWLTDAGAIRTTHLNPAQKVFERRRFVQARGKPPQRAKLAPVAKHFCYPKISSCIRKAFLFSKALEMEGLPKKKEIRKSTYTTSLQVTRKSWSKQQFQANATCLKSGLWYLYTHDTKTYGESFLIAGSTRKCKRNYLW